MDAEQAHQYLDVEALKVLADLDAFHAKISQAVTLLMSRGYSRRFVNDLLRSHIDGDAPDGPMVGHVVLEVDEWTNEKCRNEIADRLRAAGAMTGTSENALRQKLSSARKLREEWIAKQDDQRPSNERFREHEVSEGDAFAREFRSFVAERRLVAMGRLEDDPSVRLMELERLLEWTRHIQERLRIQECVSWGHPKISRPSQVVCAIRSRMEPHAVSIES